MVRQKQENVSQFSVRFPDTVIEEIDQICKSNYITRTSWLLKAAKEKLENERIKSAQEVIDKIARKEAQ